MAANWGEIELAMAGVRRATIRQDGVLVVNGLAP